MKVAHNGQNPIVYMTGVPDGAANVSPPGVNEGAAFERQKTTVVNKNHWGGALVAGNERQKAGNKHR